MTARPAPDSTSQHEADARRHGRRLPLALAGAAIVLLIGALVLVSWQATGTTGGGDDITSMLSRVTLRGDPGPSAAVPQYTVDADIDPTTGSVHATVEVERVESVLADGSVAFRVLPATVETAFEVEAKVDGKPVTAHLEETTLHVPVPDETVSIRLEVDYVLPVLPEPAPGDLLGDLVPLLGEDEPDTELVSMFLGRSENRVLLGHWLPVAIAASGVTGADLGMGDIGNFPAADWAVRIRLPAEWSLTTNAESVEATSEGGVVAHGEAGRSLRDLSAVAGRDLEATSVDADGVTVRAWSSGGRLDQARESARIAADALSWFEARWGEYPWAELDVVDTPLPLSVGGVEWSGAVWIASDVFAGGIPGSGEWADELADVMQMAEAASGFVDGDLGRTLQDVVGALRLVRDFTIAHEVAHQWWYGIVGSDQIRTAAVDEPLAQYGACRFLADSEGNAGRTACDANTELTYLAMRILGEPDGAVDRPTTEFETTTGYGGIVYGKGPGFWQALEAAAGTEAVDRALSDVIRTHAHDIVTPDELVETLSGSMGGRAEETRGLWEHWMVEENGDADIGGPESVLGDSLATVSELLGALRSGDIGTLLDALVGDD